MPSGEKTRTNYLRLMDNNAEVIMAHAMDPIANPLPVRHEAQYDRVITAARLLDSYPDQAHVENLMRAKYDVSLTQIRADISLARELFKTQHTFDWDFWFAWMIKDQIALIQRCKEQNDLKNWNAAKKALQSMIGEKPASETDPQRMMKNLFVIQVNNLSGGRFEVPLEQMQNLTAEEKKTVIDALYEPVDDDQVDKIFES